jgi:hypothetical protein
MRSTSTGFLRNASIYYSRMRNKFSPFELLFGAIAVVSFGIILYPGVANMAVAGDDAMLHLRWIEEFNKLKDSGMFYPRFCGDFQGHLGSPIFYFYPPLSFFVAWCFHDVYAPATPNGLFNIVQFLATMLSVASFYVYSGSFSKRTSNRILSALLYAALPYRFLDAFVRSAFSEHVAFVFIPLVLLGIERARERLLSGKKGIPVHAAILTAFSWTALGVSSIPMTAMMLMITVPYLFIRIPMRPTRYVVEYVCSIMLGALLAAAYWVPLVSFLPLIHHGNVFRYASEFRYPIYFLSQSKADNFMLPATMLVASVLLFIILRKNANRFVLVLLALGAIVQIPYLADPLWSGHLFDAIVYPMRFCVLLCVAIALSFLIAEGHRRWQVMTVLSLTLIFSGYREIKWIVNHASMPPIDLTNMTFDTPMEYRMVIPSELLSNERNNDTMLREGEVITETLHDVNRSIYRVALMKPKSVTFERSFWPTWSARSSTGQALPLSCASDGRISTQLPVGNYDVDLHIEKSSAETMGMAISVGTMILVLIFSVGYWVVTYAKSSG